MSTQEESIDAFGAHILEGTVFRVNWAKKGKVAKKGREGGEYDAPCILAEVKGYITPVWVEMNRKSFDTLKWLSLQGTKAFSCTLGVKGTNERYAPRIYAGAHDW